jgi:hypothetical protein
MAGTLTTSPRLQALRRILAREHHRGRPWLSQTAVIRAMLREVGKAGAVHSDIYDLRKDRDGALTAAGWWVPYSRLLRARPGAERTPHYCIARVGEPAPAPPAWMDAPRDAVPPRGAGLLGRARAWLRGAA